ncbi:hypothetical protein [Pseudofrankia asymbiotica]|uniref:hypothetical protein n=1 Tax=Pseudofrankia asymbiotica TaxID=1834516 RepID=UPI0013040DF0|nr:hypothetical protein [Pseudofrankia asymbiotica]
MRRGARRPIQQLRAALCLNHAAIGLVLDLLDRIDELEAEARTSVSAATATATT